MKCLYCYNDLEHSELAFHPTCSKKLFGLPQPPELPYTEDDMAALGKQVIQSHIAVTGVQPKLSLDVAKQPATADALAYPRFTIVGLWGGYILKPPTHRFPWLPEVEDLTMHLAEIAKIDTVPHSLIRLKNGSLAYITKRIDRVKRKRLHMEDMCQLTDRLTEDKYKGSYEQIAKAILQYSANPGLDIVNFYEQVIFSFLTGNADMHLKNFSLINSPGRGYLLAPAYDMVASALLMQDDEEELALTLNGKKRKISYLDFFQVLTANPMMDTKNISTVFEKFRKAIPLWLSFIDKGFIPEDLKENYKQLILERSHRLQL